MAGGCFLNVSQDILLDSGFPVGALFMSGHENTLWRMWSGSLSGLIGSSFRREVQLVVESVGF